MKKMIMFMTVLLVLSACGNAEKIDFKGSNQNWEIVYTAEVTGETDQQTSGTIKYIGDDKAPDVIDYKIEYKNENDNSTAGNSGNKASLKREKVDFESTVCGNCAIVQKDEEVEAEITWNGQTETILLKNDD